MGYIIDYIVLLCTSAGSPEAYDVYACVNDNRVHVRVGYIVVRHNRFKVVAYIPGTTDECIVIDKWQSEEGQFGNDGLRKVALEEATRAIKHYIECL